MNWIISDSQNFLLVLCGIFYSILCIFSIVTGIIYMSGKKELNPIELPDKFVEKLNNQDKLKAFTIKMGIVTFIVGIFQGITALSIFIDSSVILHYFAVGFTIFSICSVVIKLKGKINAFPIVKLLFYVTILIVLLRY